MHKKILLYASLLVILVLPCLLFAQTPPTVTSFKVTGSFVAGASFTITLANVPDLSTLGPKVSLEGKDLTVTGAGKNTITGKLPEGVSKKGGSVQIRYQGANFLYTLYVPYIDNVFLPKVEKGGQMLVNGGNFAETGCNVSLPNSSINVASCNQRMVFTTLGNKFSGGNITVTFNGLTSAPYFIEYQAPTLGFVENKEGIIPGATAMVHAKGFSSVAAENQISLDNKQLEIANINTKEGLIQVRLPAENAKGSLKLTVNGIESNTIALDASFPPILVNSSFSNEDNVMKVKVTGKYFSSDSTKVSMSIGSKSGSVKFSNVSNIEAEFPKGGYSGCLSVTVFGQASNCIQFNTVSPPYLKGYLDPVSAGFENKYEWTLFAENISQKNDQISVYVNGTKATLKDRLLNRLIVSFDETPDIGEVYVVSEGIESNRMPYDFGERFYPFINKVSSNGKFMYGQSVTIEGGNFSLHKFRDKVSINLNGVGLMKDEKGKEPDWNVTPSEIAIRLDDKVKAGANATLSVSVKGKKSNEVKFVTGQDSKEVFCSPWIQKIQYPEGIMEGSKIRIQGQCFSPDMKKNWVYFDTIEAKPTFAALNYMDVKIPKGVKTNGKIKVKTQFSESNQADYISSAQTPNSFTFAFEDLGTAAISEIGKEGVFARLKINNTVGDVEMQTLKFKFVYEDDQNNTNSFLKLGVLPLGEIKVAFNGVGKKTIAPMLVERTGTNEYTLTLDGIRVSPSTSPQTLEFRTIVKPFALNGAKIHMEFDPAKIDNFSGLLIKSADKQEILKLKQKAVTSATIALSKTAIATCFDSDANKTNCSGLKGSAPSQQTTVPKKPRIPSMPKQ